MLEITTIGSTADGASKIQPVVRRVFFTMVLNPWKGESGAWERVGKAYATREAARSWLPFVRGAWRNVCRVKIAQCTLRFKDGVLTERSKEILDKKFNMDAPNDKAQGSPRYPAATGSLSDSGKSK